MQSLLAVEYCSNKFHNVASLEQRHAYLLIVLDLSVTSVVDFSDFQVFAVNFFCVANCYNGGNIRQMFGTLNALRSAAVCRGSKQRS